MYISVERLALNQISNQGVGLLPVRLLKSQDQEISTAHEKITFTRTHTIIHFSTTSRSVSQHQRNNCIFMRGWFYDRADSDSYKRIDKRGGNYFYRWLVHTKFFQILFFQVNDS